VWLFFLAQIRKTDVKLIKNIGHVFCQLFNGDVFGWFACKNLNLVPTREALFQQIHVIDRF